MMLIHDINENILIPHPSYLYAYQYEAKKWDLYKEMILCFGLEPSQIKIDKTVVHVST